MNDFQPLVSIGIPTYNRASSFLDQAIRSAVEQTYKNLEIIISDNASTDHTESLVANIADKRIRYIKHPKNIGANNNFNYCVKSAKGKYFILLHSDDLIDHDFVETCLNAIQDNRDVGVVFTGSRVIDEDDHVTGSTPNRAKDLSLSDFFLKWFAGKTAFYCCSTMFSTKKLQEIGGFNSKTNCFQDVVADVILASRFGRVDVYDVKASFRRHSMNLGGSVSTIMAWCEDCIFLMDIMHSLCEDNEQVIKEEGLRYFAKKNYKLASKIKSPVKRIKTYLYIHKTFKSSLSPIQFLYYRDINPLISRLRRYIRSTLRG